MALSDAVPFAVAAWNLDEASGTRADSVGSSDLTDNNTVGSASGKFGNAADFEDGSSEYLSRADNAALSMGDVDFVLRCWVQLESKTDIRSLICKWDTGANQREYFLIYRQADDRFELSISASGGGTDASVQASNFGSPSTATWYLIHAWHDSVNNQIGIAVNAGTANTASYSGGVLNGTSDFCLGSLTPSGALFHDGLLDDVVVLKGYILDATERTEDYNGGTGVAFADWAGGGFETYTGTSALVGEVATLSSTGAFTAPTYTGTSSLTSEVATLSSTGEFDAPVYTATSSFTAEIATLSATGIFATAVFTGTSSLTSEIATLSSSATFTVPTYTGTSALTSEVATLSASGSFVAPVYSGTSSLTGEVATLSTIATFTVPTYTGTSTLVNEIATLSGIGAFTPSLTYTGIGTLAAEVATLVTVGDFEPPDDLFGRLILIRVIDPSYIVLQGSAVPSFITLREDLRDS